MNMSNDIDRVVLDDRRITGKDKNVREYILLKSCGFDQNGADRGVYSLFARRDCLAEGNTPTGQVFLYDIAPTYEEAQRIFEMLSEGEAEPEHCRDIVEDLWC